MKWGIKYDARYVNILAKHVSQQLSGKHRFVCLTDDAKGLSPGIEALPIPSMPHPNRPEVEAWRKLALFSPELPLEGETLFLDLDVVVMRDLSPFFAYPGAFCIIHNWTHPKRRVGNSSVMRFKAGEHVDAFRRFARAPEAIALKYRNEQRFLSDHVDETHGLTWWPAPWCLSFKRHCIRPAPLRWFLAPRRPEECRIVVFHGTPNPPEAAAHWRYGRSGWRGALKFTPPSGWVRDLWNTDVLE